MYAVLADIHGNLEALTAVLADIRARGIGRVICLGDVVGFGPDPAACVDLAGEFAVTVRGCFDHRIFEDVTAFNPGARADTEWVRTQLTRGAGAARRADFLRSLPLVHAEGASLFAHTLPADGTWWWLHPPTAAERRESPLRLVPEPLPELFERLHGPAFVGHTHVPGLIRKPTTLEPAPELGMTCRLEPDRPAIVNVGAVGWPRDGDARAAYVIVDGDVVEWRRVPYDHAETTRKLGRLPHAPAAWQTRLASGW